MSRYHSYLNSAVTVIDSYTKGTPLTHHLKSFFQTDKKFGSKDRKSISTLCYHYYRCSFLFKETETTENKIIASSFLCENSETEFLKNVSPEFNEFVSFSTIEKLAYLNINAEKLFLFSDEISDFIDKHKFSLSLLKQPELFLRMRPKRKDQVLAKLKNADIPFEIIDPDTLKLTNGTSIENCFDINKEVVIQDLNSQKVFDFFKKEKAEEKSESVWDCCAASGGKSILLFDLFSGKIKLTVSDIRENILTNLQLRFKDAGINLQKKFVQDLSQKSGLLLDEKFSIIICDAPCSGSGTWSRTPEQYFSFDKIQLQQFVEKQKKIVVNTLPHLAKDGWFVYITCSVFKAENEDMVDFIQQHFSYQLLEMKYLKGFDKNADSLFVAYFKN
ncbi:MAG: RsmB/NOP family class I SAM-dependent RNA methyltransferase [Sphingobacteriales bacterium]|nr:RsmB/NOP family class I SAM-dependent RNA methyltransferase [Sphingobacteriales bacterium]